MPSRSPLDATRHHSIVRERADDNHNINITVEQISRRVSNLYSKSYSQPAEKGQIASGRCHDARQAGLRQIQEEISAQHTCSGRKNLDP